MLDVVVDSHSEDDIKTPRCKPPFKFPKTMREICAELWKLLLTIEANAFPSSGQPNVLALFE